MKALAFNPHSDDCIIGIGGMIIKLLNKNWSIGYVYMTDSRHGSNEMSEEKTSRVRAKEATKERDILGIMDYWEFGVEDGKLQYTEGSARERIKLDLAQILDEWKPDIIFIPSESDNHPDHRATHDIICEVISSNKMNTLIGEYIVWLFPDFYGKRTRKSEKILLVSIDNEMSRKVRALGYHRSQLKRRKYVKIMKSIDFYFAQILKKPSDPAPEYAEVIGLFNRKRQRVEDKLIEDLGEPKDITDIYHGREVKKIKA